MQWWSRAPGSWARAAGASASAAGRGWRLHRARSQARRGWRGAAGAGLAGRAVARRDRTAARTRGQHHSADRGPGGAPRGAPEWSTCVCSCLRARAHRVAARDARRELGGVAGVRRAALRLRGRRHEQQRQRRSGSSGRRHGAAAAPHAAPARAPAAVPRLDGQLAPSAHVRRRSEPAARSRSHRMLLCPVQVPQLGRVPRGRKCVHAVPFSGRVEGICPASPLRSNAQSARRHQRAPAPDRACATATVVHEWWCER